MRRFHLFEFNERPEVPRILRAQIVEALGLGQLWGRLLDPLAPVFAEFLARTGADRVLDLCSGGGEPACILLDALRRAGRTLPRLTLSDRLPDPRTLEKARRRHPASLEVAPHPVDATAVPDTLDAPVRLVLSGFHHLPPDVARATLADVVARRRSIFIGELFPRRLLPALPVMPWVYLGMLALPFTGTLRDLPWRILSAWVFQLTETLAAWDWLVSVLRIYTEAELREMAEAAGGGYRWEYREIRGRLGHRLVVFTGTPGEG